MTFLTHRQRHVCEKTLSYMGKTVTQITRFQMRENKSINSCIRIVYGYLTLGTELFARWLTLAKNIWSLGWDFLILHEYTWWIPIFFVLHVWYIKTMLLLKLYTYHAGFVLLHCMHLKGDDGTSVRLSAPKPGLNPRDARHWPFQGGTSFFKQFCICAPSSFLFLLTMCDCCLLVHFVPCISCMIQYLLLHFVLW